LNLSGYVWKTMDHSFYGTVIGYAPYRTVTFPMTLSDLWRSFQYCCYFVCAADARSL